MKKLFLVFAVCAFIGASCGNSGSGGAEAEIAQLEKEHESNPNPENTKKLLDQYMAHVQANPDDPTNANYLYRAAALQYRMNRFSNSVDILKRALKYHYDGDSTPSNALLLGAIYENKLRNPASAMTIYQGFAQAFPNDKNAANVKRKIPANAPSLNERIVELGKRMYNDSLQKVDYKVVNDFINCCELYALMLPQNPQSPEMLHKAGEAARSIRSFPKALELYEWISEKYNNSPKGPQAMFLRAFTLDNDMKKYDEAKVIYEEFLKKYPDDEFADDTKFLLQNLGKSDEEIINSFSKKEQ